MDKTKKFISDQKVSHAWARTLTFLKLARMKVESNTYKLPFEEYKQPLIVHFREMEYSLRKWGMEDGRSVKWYTDCPFEKMKYDEEIRGILDKINLDIK